MEENNHKKYSTTLIENVERSKVARKYLQENSFYYNGHDLVELHLRGIDAELMKHPAHLNGANCHFARRRPLPPAENPVPRSRSSR
jgi:hypothetical protein